MPGTFLRLSCGLCLQVNSDLMFHCVARISFVSLWLAWSRMLLCSCEQCADMNNECLHGQSSHRGDAWREPIDTHLLSPCPPASGT